MNEALRDLVNGTPHRPPNLTGVYSLRSPPRPGPLALATVEIIVIDQAPGRITIDAFDAIDCLDGTPTVDGKPWRSRMDLPPDRLASARNK